MTRPLSRNRDFNLLWISQTGAELANQMFFIVYPLIALALTGSAIAAGMVGFAFAGEQLRAGLPAGLLADRWSRRGILLVCAAVRALAFGSLALALSTGTASYGHVLVVAVIEGVALAMTFPAEDAALPQIVPAEQLSSAVAVNSARVAIGQLAGNALGGLLFGLARVVPFLGAAVLHLGSLLLLSFVRIPPVRRTSTPEDRPGLGHEMVAGIRWILRQPVIRITALCAVALNFSFAALYLVIIVWAQQRGTPAAHIGLMGAMLGVGGIAGALLASSLSRRLSPYAAVAGVIWLFALLVPIMAFVPNVFLVGGLLATAALLAPTANSAITTYQTLLTPDHLRGRLSGSIGVLDGLAGALGPALGGLLIAQFGGRTAILLCGAVLIVPVLVATFSPVLRGFRGLPDTPADDRDEPELEPAVSVRDE